MWESDPEFMKYSLDKFRAAYNRAKADVGAHVRPAEGEFLSGGETWYGESWYISTENPVKF